LTTLTPRGVFLPALLVLKTVSISGYVYRLHAHLPRSIPAKGARLDRAVFAKETDYAMGSRACFESQPNPFEGRLPRRPGSHRALAFRSDSAPLGTVTVWRQFPRLNRPPFCPIISKTALDSRSSGTVTRASGGGGIDREATPVSACAVDRLKAAPFLAHLSTLDPLPDLSLRRLDETGDQLENHALSAVFWRRGILRHPSLAANAPAPISGCSARPVAGRGRRPDRLVELVPDGQGGHGRGWRTGEESSRSLR